MKNKEKHLDTEKYVRYNSKGASLKKGQLRTFGMTKVSNLPSSRIRDPITDESVENPQAHFPADPSNKSGGERNANI